MCHVADPNASRHDRSADDDNRLPEPHASSEIVDAEVVEDDGTSRSPRSTPQDDDSFRQYQQFLEFQKFQEWQRQQGEPDEPHPVGEPTKATTPWWKRLLRLLRFRFVRRLLYLLLLLLLLTWLYDYYFGDSGSGGGGTGTGGAPPQSTPITSPNAKAAIRGVYNYVAYKPETACKLFTDTGKSAFAYSYGTPTCEEAAKKANSQVTVPGTYSNPKFGADAIQETPDTAIVNSCAAEVQGGPRLGKFQLSKAPDGGWLIDNYNAAQC